MAKSVMKEIIIALLLCLAILLVLGIILYEYVPITKTIPNQVVYTTPEDVKQELLTSSDVDESQVVMTYEVNSDDLSNYKKIRDYVPGKANPFSSYDTSQTNGEETTNNSSQNQGTTSGGNQAGNTTNQNNSNNGQNSGQNSVQNTGATQTSQNTTTSGGKYFNDKGTK